MTPAGTSAVPALQPTVSRVVSTRMGSLDGLRGWAALSVVFFHFTWETFGHLFPVFRSLGFAVLGNGGLAIALFFALSGYVLTIRRWRRTDNEKLLPVLLRRYLRLEIPVMASALLFWAALSVGGSHAMEASHIVQRDDWLGTFANFEPSFLAAVWFGLARVYLLNQTETYGPFLWTMATELWGSLLVLSLSQSRRIIREPYSLLIMVIAPLVIFYPIAACFPIGAAIALLQRDGVIRPDEPCPLNSFVALCGLGATLLAAACFEMLGKDIRPAVLLATLILLCALYSVEARRFLVLPISRWLGRLSFPLYLVQGAVLMTATSWLINLLAGANALTIWTALSIAVVSTGGSLLLARLFLPIENLTLSLVGRMKEATQRRATAPLIDSR